MNFVGPNSESDIADQVQMLNSAINAKPAAIGLAALSTDACNDALQQAKDAGIPIVGFDSGVPGAPEGSVVANAATDNYAAGELAAEKTYEVLKDRIAAAEGSVRIGVMGQDATSESIVNRGLGFIDKIAELATADGHTVTVEGNDKYVQDSKVEATDDAKVIIDVAVPSQVTAELSATDCQTLLNKEDTICIYGSNQHSGDSMVVGNENLQKFGVPVVVTLNAFVSDTEAETAYVEQFCKEHDCEFALAKVWEKGGEGGIALANKILETLEKKESHFHTLYSDDLGLKEKIETVAKEIYGADGVTYSPAAERELKRITDLGMANFPVCMAKTQYSLSDDAKKLGRPTGFKINVREVYVSAGAGFVVAVNGSIMTLPGLPKKPAAYGIDVNDDGVITGLF